MRGPRPTTATLLRALADLAPSGGDGRADLLDVRRGGRPFVWVGTAEQSWRVFTPPPSTPLPYTSPNGASIERGFALSWDLTPAGRARHETVRRLARLDALHREERLLRAGWVFLAGRAHLDGEDRMLLHPLVSVPVRVVDRLGLRVEQAGDLELTPLVPPAKRAALEGAFHLPDIEGWEVTDRSLRRFPTFLGWIRDVVAAAGLGDARVVTGDPADHRDGPGLVATVGTGLYQARDVDSTDLPTTLRNWAGYAGPWQTAFTHVLDPDGVPPAPPPPDIARPDPPVPLTRTQHDAVRRSRSSPVTVVSGPPGSGKSHTVAAIALDALAAGQRVLVATQTVHASAVLADMLSAMPGPEPVVFGDAESRGRLAAILADGLDDEADRSLVREATTRVAETAREAGWLHGAVTSALALESDAASTLDPDWQARLPLHRAAAPAAFAPDLTDGELAELEATVARADVDPTGWWSRRRARRAEHALRSETGAGPTTPLPVVARAVRAARQLRRAAHLASTGGTSVGPLIEALARAEDERRAALGELLTVRSRSGAARDRPARRAAQELATALRSGRAMRRQHLAQLDSDALLAALPLWVGTLRDIDELLPPRAGMFDLLVLDEASQIDLPRAAPALLRARRAVVAGDPRQLRHVSFVADADVQATLAAHGIPHLLDRLDVRRLSALDTAVGATAPVWLDEHFRSVPHLIEFSARRFYPGTVHVATRHPGNECHDAITTVAVHGARGDGGVNVAEVEAVEATVRGLAARGERSIGVVSPFRAQADALEAMLLDRFSLEEIEQLDLRVGTVHAFQGAERDVVVLSLALSPDDPAGSRRFVEDPHLFNVMVTRARHEVVLVHSLGGSGTGSAPDGLVAQYLDHAERPPGPPARGEPADPWVRALTAELERAGLTCRHAYPVGRWTLDLCVGDGADAVAVVCRVHQEGPSVHIERHLQLRRSGWRILEGWPSRFDDDPVRAAITLAGELRRA